MKKNKVKIKKQTLVFLDFDDIKNPLLAAGQARATVEVGKRLVEKGFEVISICSKYPGYKDRVENGIYYKHIGIGTNNIKLNNIFYILSIPWIVKSLKCDLIIECFTAPISTLMSPLWTKIPVIAIPTSFEADRFSQLYHFPFDKVERFGMKHYKYFLPYTKHMEEKFKKVNPKVITEIIPEGVGKEFFKIKKRTPKHILYLGRFDVGQKGIDLLLEAYAKIKHQSKYPLVIAGKGPDENNIKKLIKEYSLLNKVKVQGAAYGEKKAKLLSESLFVLMPSRHEGFSLFALEALASGNPLVGFDIPGLSWSNDKAIYKAKPFDIDSYSKLILRAEREVEKNKLGERARKLAGNYSWDSVADKFSTFINKVIN